MNEYYYCKATNLKCCYTIVRNDGCSIVGKILKIDSQDGNFEVGGQLHVTTTLCELITDLDLINELDKIMTFQ